MVDFQAFTLLFGVIIALVLILPLLFLIGFSIRIEFSQGVLDIGLCEFDDMFNNSLGALIGFGAIKLLKKTLRSTEG